MLRVSRVLVLAVATAFLAAGSTLAQGAPPPPAGTPAPQQKKNKNCKSTPKGCNKSQKNNKSTGGAPQGGMPSPHP